MVKYSVTWDYLGAGVSAACVLHCLLVPAAVLTLPVLGVAALDTELVHRILAAVIVPVAVLAAVPGVRRHGRRAVFSWMAAGLALVLFAAFGGGDALGGWWEEGLTVAGGAMLVWGHWLNRTFCRVQGTTCPDCVAGSEDSDPFGSQIGVEIKQ